MKLSKETALYEKDAIKNGINNAAGTATKYVTLIDDNTGIFVSPEGEGPKDKPNTKTGWSISDAIELFKNGVSYIKAWLNGSTPIIRIGTENGGNVKILDSRVDICDGDDELAEFYSDNGVTWLASTKDLHISAPRVFVFDNAGWAGGPLGQPFSRTASISLTSDGVSNYVSGPVLDVKPGLYLIIGNCKFPTISSDGTRHNSIRLLHKSINPHPLPNDDGVTYETIGDSYSIEGARFTATLNAAFLFMLDDTGENYGYTDSFILQASSSKTPVTCTGTIMAVRLL